MLLNIFQFKGRGVDLRKRRIWDVFGAHVSNNLFVCFPIRNDCIFEKVESVDPSAHPGFPDATWLIGNHSDELTPWLPILAARSSANCRVFTIPCCPFSLFKSFDGGFYLRQKQRGGFKDLGGNVQISVPVKPDFWRGRYRTYICYLHQVFFSAGLEQEFDILRIPSTRRVSLFPLNYFK